MWRTINRALATISPRFQSWLSVQEARIRGPLIVRGWIKPRVISFKGEGFRIGLQLGVRRPWWRLW